ncbi:CRISPR-associated RAMP family protein [Dissulfurispira thermophila]|uniref:CRISPR-associated RAMP family protein n=1 Tax=Dissulfurispira thermophila TaxID=2715679 RepID=A0A7G1H1A8_9BACT|nr:TIGR03986 family CRISPR-associated RAMP protein [Dissulfurispira thermophila]BCB96585.1 CRISPR-associated RAMP family protein [Dissulfurispira thermophila]
MKRARFNSFKNKGKKSGAVPSQRKSSPSQAPAHNNADIYSKAPYNFIPLNDRVVKAEPVPVFNRYHSDRFTGYIDLEIKALTPLYIRDALTMEEYRERDKMEQEKKTFINPDFFSPGGILRIPGSSLRGMIRTMVEIVSYGKFESFENKRLYYRAVGDTSKLGLDYRDTMVDTENNYFPKVKAGILKKTGYREYRIYPSKEIERTQIYRINFDKRTGIVDGTKDFKLESFESKDVFFKPVSPQDHTHYRFNKKTGMREAFLLRYAKLTSISLTKDPNHPNKGFIIASGHMDKKHMHWVINEPEENYEGIEIPEEVIKEYQNDGNRKAPNILEKANKKQNGVPCFYITASSGRILSFGHTGMFRLAYQKTIGDHVPSDLKSNNITDLATAIFGDTEKRASRVFFEDAIFDGEPQSALLKTDIPKILSGPKPTCFQHYLEQKPENLKNHPKELAHYNSNNPVRGYKLYWHRTPEGWEEIEISYDEKKFYELLGKYQINKKDFQPYILEEKNKKIKISLNNLPDNIRQIVFESIGIYETQHTKLTPVKEGTTFRGRIRFENLSNVELGALLFVLDLPENLAHKLGMGKPLGLGSVEIKPTLYISDREKRYKDLFSEWAGIEKSADNNKFKKAFEDYMHNNEKKQSLWEVSRLKELKQMLDIKSKPDNSKTTYMVVDEFRKRKVLPKPTDV